jgi:hypothetical protein
VIGRRATRRGASRRDRRPSRHRVVRHHVEVSELLALGRDLQWPAITLGPVPIGGDESWRRAILRTTPGERAALLTELEPALLSSTDIGKLRFERWRAAPSTPMSRERVEEAILDKVLVFGDDALLRPIVRGLATVPPFVREAAVVEICWVAVGRTVAGWTTNGQFADRDGMRPYTIVISGAYADEDVESIVVHELGHYVHLAPPDPGKCMNSVCGLQRVHALLARTGSPAPALVQLEEAREERRARALEWIWSSGRSSDEHG